jgi:hypothetical protein
MRRSRQHLLKSLYSRHSDTRHSPQPGGSVGDRLNTITQISATSRMLFLVSRRHLRTLATTKMSSGQSTLVPSHVSPTASPKSPLFSAACGGTWRATLRECGDRADWTVVSATSVACSHIISSPARRYAWCSRSERPCLTLPGTSQRQRAIYRRTGLSCCRCRSRSVRWYSRIRSAASSKVVSRLRLLTMTCVVCGLRVLRLKAPAEHFDIRWSSVLARSLR